MVSVIMPAFNAMATIESSIDSVINQTYDDWELLIVDDASSDETVKMIRAARIKDKRIRLFTNERNIGTAMSRNKAVLQARGEYIAFLDSDDLWHKDKLVKQLEFMERMNAVVSYTGTAYICEGKHSSFILKAKLKTSYGDLLRHNIMSCSSVVMRRDIILQHMFICGPHYEDYVAWLQILKETEQAYGLDEPLLTYRVSSKSKSGNIVRAGLMNFRAYRQVGYTRQQSLLLSMRYALYSVPKRIKIRMYTER